MPQIQHTNRPPGTSFKPLLAVDAELSRCQFPYLGSPKIDGIRCLITADGAVTRSLKKIPNDHIRSALANVPVGYDGELLTFSSGARDGFNTVQSKVMKAYGKPDFVFLVFDNFEHAGAFRERHASLRPMPFVEVVKHRMLHSSADLDSFEAECVDRDGWEGVMLRAPGGAYKFGRSTVNEAILLKVKRFSDDEARIIGAVELCRNINEGSTNALGLRDRSSAKAGLVGAGMLGALRCQWNGVEFEIGTGFTEMDRQTLWDRRVALIGKTVNFSFFGTGANGRPRHPSFRGIRYDVMHHEVPRSAEVTPAPILVDLPTGRAAQPEQIQAGGGKIEVGQTAVGAVIALPLAKANRHGLITGSTGSGKTTSMQRIIEQFSAAGVPVFAADVKGDLSGIAAHGNDASPLAARTAALGRPFTADRFPVALWDLYGTAGLPIRTSVQGIGCDLLATMLRLNEVQAGTLAIAFRKSEDDRQWMLTLDDLRWTLAEMLEEREQTCQRYGNVTAASIAAIQRQILALEAQGGDRLFGEPPFSILDFMRTDASGRGVVNLLHADRLIECPKLYATFLLWLLTELFRSLPEVGDIEKPKLVFFFDEAHLLFTDAPKALVEQIERLVRLVRSKGVGVFFVTQSPGDVPDTVLAQLGTRIAHLMRAYTPAAQKTVRATVQAFRTNAGVDVKGGITTLGVGEAFISVLDDAGVPTPVEKISIIPPSAQVGPLSSMERRAIMDAAELRTKYAADIDESAAIGAFKRRMRAARGIQEPRGNHDGAAWQPGDYRKFLPFNTGDRPAPARRAASWAGVAMWAVVTISCVALSGWILA